MTASVARRIRPRRSSPRACCGTRTDGTKRLLPHELRHLCGYRDRNPVMRRLMPLAVLLALLVPAAMADAHPERTTFFPDWRKGSVPTLAPELAKGGKVHIVCTSES